MSCSDRESEQGSAATLAEEHVAEAAAASLAEEPCILFATNGSAESEAALHFAAALARREKRPLRVLTVLEPLPAIPAQPVGASYHFGIELERGERILNIVREEFAANGIGDTATAVMRVGTPAATIAESARDWHADYIVVGGGRHGALERMLAGDILVRVLRHAPVPVIAVPPDCHALPHNGMVAVDFGPTSLAAARNAATIIGTGVLNLVHVRPEIDMPASDPDAWCAIYESGAQSLLTQLAGELREAYPALRIGTDVLRGHTPTVLLDHARRVGAEFIAVGQHSRGVMDRFLFGSVANAMVRGARCAVLVEPPSARAR